MPSTRRAKLTFSKGAAVAVNCHNFYVDYNFNVEKSEQELISVTCANDAAPDKVRYIEHVEAVNPGHETAGNTEYWILDGKYYSDAEATQEIELADTVVEPTGHNFDDGEWGYSLKEHWRICPDDNAESEHVAHTPDGSGNCTVCGARPLGTLQRVPAKESSCTEAGNIEYWTDGYYYFEDENHTVATTLEKVTLNKLPHTLDGNFIPDGNRHYKQCSECQEKVYSEHVYSDGQCECGAYEALTYKLLQTKSYTATGNSGAWMTDWDNGNSIWHFGIGLSHFLDGDGKVVKDAVVKVAMRSETSDWSEEDQNNVIVNLNAANDTVTVTFQTYITNWAVMTPYTLSAQQRAQIGTDRVLHVYVLHTKFGSEHKDILCVRDTGGVVTTGIETGTKPKTSYQRHIVETLTDNVSLVVDIVNFGTAGKTYKHPVSTLISGATDKFTAPARVIKFVRGTAATCTESGVCDYYTDGIKNYADADGSEELQTTVIPALDHDFDTAQYKTNPQYHWYECKRCGAKQSEEGHSWSNGVCAVCHTEQKAPDNLTDFPANEATCTTPGNIACKTDGTYYWTADGKWLSEEEVFTTPALGHNPVYVTTEVEHYKKCTRCGEEEAGTRGNHSFTDGVCSCGEKLTSKVKTFTGESEETFGGYDADGAAHTRFGPFNNGLARFIVKAPDAFGADGSIKSAATVTMELRGCGGWYQHFGVKLNLNTSGSSISFVVNEDVIGGASDYVLTEYQVNALKDGGLEIFIETEAKKRFIYVKTSDGEIACVYRFTAASDDNQIRNFRVIYAQAEYGAEVSYDVVNRGGNNVRDVIESNFDSAYTICWGKWNGESKAQQKDDGTYQKVEVKTGDIGAKSDNNFIHFNVKLDKQLATGECISLKYNGWSDKDFGVSTRLKFDGTKYVLSNCGLWNGSWVTFGSGVALTEAQSNKLVTDGLDFFYTQHGKDEFMSLYVYDGNSLTKLCDVCSKSNKPYSATASINAGDNDQTYTGKSIATIKIDWYTYLPETEAEDAVKNYLGINA